MEWVNTDTHQSNFITAVDTLQSTKIVFSNGLGKLGVWSLDSDTYVQWQGHTHWIDCVKVLHEWTFASGAKDGLIKIWNLRRYFSSDKKIVFEKSLDYRPAEHTVINICTMGKKHLVSSHQHKENGYYFVVVWDWKKGTVLRQFKGSGTVRSQAVQCLNREIFIAKALKNAKDITVWGFDSFTRETLRTGHRDNVTSIAVLGNKLVTGSKDKTIKVWKRSGNSWLVQYKQLTQGNIKSIYTADDKVIYATDDKRITIWDVKTRIKNTIVLDEKTLALGWCAGKLVTGSLNGVRLWEYKDASSPVVKLGYKTFPSGTRLFTLITSETFDRTRDLAFFGKHLGLNVRATLHATILSNNLWLHVFNTTGPLRMLTAPKHWRQEIFGAAYLSLAEVERRLTKYCQQNGYDGWHMRVKMDNRVSNVKEAEFETVVLKSSFDKLQFRGKKRITLEDLKDKDHVRVSKKGKITFVKRIERLEEMFENLRF
tara:strand:+ start:142 stop:1590 length:1449 start_codon:yes stop_codon:yes gene_type:complete